MALAAEVLATLGVPGVLEYSNSSALGYVLDILLLGKPQIADITPKIPPDGSEQKRKRR